MKESLLKPIKTDQNIRQKYGLTAVEEPPFYSIDENS